MEVLVSIMLLAVGMVGVLGGLRALDEGQARAFDVERVHRLAVRKLDDLIATEQLGGTDSTGDFGDWGEAAYEWKATVQPTGIENLQQVTLTVTKAGAKSTDPSAKVDSLFYEPPQTSGGVTQ